MTRQSVPTTARAAAKAKALTDLGLSENADEKVVVREFKKTVAGGEKALKELRTNTRKLAELASVLVDHFGNSQAEVAAKIGFSQQWVSAVLKWKKGEFAGLPFVPLLPAPPPPTLPGTGKDPTVGMPRDGIVRSLGNDTLPPDVSADLRMAAEGNKAARQRLLDVGYVEAVDGLTGKAVFTAPDAAAPPVEVTPQPPPVEVTPQPPTTDNGHETVIDEFGSEETRSVKLVEPLDASWFYELSPATAAVRACHELIKRGLIAHDLFKIAAETLLPLMNEPTRALAGKLAGVLSREKAA